MIRFGDSKLQACAEALLWQLIMEEGFRLPVDVIVANGNAIQAVQYSRALGRITRSAADLKAVAKDRRHEANHFTSPAEIRFSDRIKHAEFIATQQDDGSWTAQRT
jgi:hypothetical protein